MIRANKQSKATLTFQALIGLIRKFTYENSFRLTAANGFLVAGYPSIVDCGVCGLHPWGVEHGADIAAPTGKNKADPGPRKAIIQALLAQLNPAPVIVIQVLVAMVSRSSFSSVSQTKVPFSVDLAWRIFSGFTFFAIHILFVYGAIVYVVASALHLHMAGFVIEAVFLGVPTLLVIAYVLRMVVRAELDPENN